MFKIKLLFSFLILLSGCFLVIMQAVGKEIEDDKRYKGLSEAHIEIVKDLEEDHRELFDLWIEVRENRQALANEMMILGRYKRRRAEISIRRLERNFERLKSRFREMLDGVKGNYEDNYERLQDKLWEKRMELDSASPDEVVEQEQQLSHLREEALEVKERVSALKSVWESANEDLPNQARRMRFTNKRHHAYLTNNVPGLLEYRMKLLDSLADLKVLYQKKLQVSGDDWGVKEENDIQSLIEIVRSSRDLLERKVELELRNENRSREKLLKRLLRLERRVEGSSGNRQERLREKLEEKQDELAHFERIIKRYRLIVEIPEEFSKVITLVE